MKLRLPSLMEVVILNLLVAFALWLFFRGGAFPSGEINEGRYVVHGFSGSPTQVSETWFWITFFHGMFAWVSIALFVVFSTLSGALEFEGSRAKQLVQKTGTIIFAVLMSYFGIQHGVEISI